MYERWSKNAHGECGRDPKIHPGHPSGFSKADPANRHVYQGRYRFVYGSKWKQRYFTRWR